MPLTPLPATQRQVVAMDAAQLRTERLVANEEKKRQAELDEKIKKAERLRGELQAEKERRSEEYVSLREQVAASQVEKRLSDEMRARLEQQVEALSRDLEESKALNRSQAEERDAWQSDRARTTAQLELMQRQRSELEALARRWQADNEALHAKLDAATYKAEQLSTEREEATRQRDTEMGQLQAESSRLGEMMRLSLQAAQQERASTAERVALAEARCSKLLGLLEAAHAEGLPTQLAVARTELRGLDERHAALLERAQRAEAWAEQMMRERDEARDEVTRLGQLDVVQERVHEFTGAAMRDRFQTLSHQLTGQWPDEWCEALIASTE